MSGVKQEYVERNERCNKLNTHNPYEAMSESSIRSKEHKPSLESLKTEWDKLYKYNDKIVIKRLKFDCAYCSKTSIPISKLVSHFTHKWMNFVYHKCPAYLHWQYEGLRADYNQHINSCEFIEVECSKWNNDIMRKDIDTHSWLNVTKIIYEEWKK